MMGIVALAQMFYTIGQTDCASSIPESPICSVRDSYRVVYLLLRGEALVDPQGVTETAPGAIFLIACFLALAVLVTVGLLVSLISAATRQDLDTLALDYFWEPKLAFVLSSTDLGLKDPTDPTALMRDSDSIRTKEHRWNTLMSYFTRDRLPDDKLWYTKARPGVCSTLWACIVVPIWFLAGIASLGILWPPQLRRMVFHPGMQAQRRDKPVDHTIQINKMRDELVQLKTMSYERSNDLEDELRSLKELLFLAIRESS